MPATITYSVYLGQNLRSEVVISAVEFLSLGMEYYSATKKKEIMPSTATWMNLEIIILGEVS